MTAERNRRLGSSLLVATWIAAAWWNVPLAAGVRPRAAQAPADSAATHRAVLDRYCVTCHNARLKTAGLMLDGLDLAQVPEHAEAWEKVVTKLRAGTMPPPGAPRPDEAAQAALVTWLETTIDRASAARPNPGRPALHRLNRAEYQNAIRDLLALDVDAAALLPPDDSSYGFDNVADVLGVSPALLERYRPAIGPARQPRRRTAAARKGCEC